MKYSWCPLLCAVMVLMGGSVLAAPIEAPAAEAGAKAASAADKKPAQPAEAGKPAASPKEAPQEPLRNIDGAPLVEKDFTAGGISLGDPLSFAVMAKGQPEKIQAAPVHSDYEWKDLVIRAVNPLSYRYMNRKDLDIPGKETLPGIEAVYLKGPSMETARGIRVGSRRENVLRVYGKPSQVLWDGRQGCFYAVYDAQGKMLVFTLAGDKVTGIRISVSDSGFSGKKADPLRLGSGEDFRIAGYAVGDAFQEYPWLVWEKKAVNPEEEVWYYPGFGARMDVKHKILSALFITDPRMITWRGLTAGDQMSTVEALYGAPQKVEMTEMEGHPQAAYIYFSKDKKEVLIFYIDEAEKVVRHIMVMGNPQIKNPLQHALDRISQVRRQNEERRRT